MRKEELCNYLDEVAKEAVQLAKIWHTVLLKITSKSITPDEQLLFDEKWADSYGPNCESYFTLKSFYEYLTTATEGKYSKHFRNNFVDNLGRVLYGRNITLEYYRKALNNKFNPLKYASGKSSENDIGELVKSVAFLQKQASELTVLAKTIRTMKD